MFTELNNNQMSVLMKTAKESCLLIFIMCQIMYIRYIILSYATPREYINIILIYKSENRRRCLAKCAGIVEASDLRYF